MKLDFGSPQVPTVAIETCFIYNNTSIIPDESLAHRLGLIPINVDPRVFKFEHEEGETHEKKAVFSLQVACKRIPKSSLDAPEEEKYTDSKGIFHRVVLLIPPVYSRQLKWIPQGNQMERVSHLP